MKAFSIYTDSELVDLLNAGNRAAFDEIYHRHWKSLYRTAYRVLKDEGACLDLLQDIFIWLWEHRGHLEVRVLHAYLSMAVKYKVANYIRQLKVRPSLFEEVEKLEIPDTATISALALNELKTIIAAFTEELPERCRQVFYLSRIEYLSNKEIAARLGVSEKTVENQLTIALKKLRLKLGSLHLWMFFL
ncbi:RNA polymerase sigma-70 factor [Chitinophaga lutea]|uniref:RNA polymerase sigma-70 factor n=1 Tax=Chitinophaga lutea TaxID=2488634 RepID=A0A3N4QC11_9BACT|nr:RNA polymerase sigma-70 factor [Chitinophaga lutea]RPE13520.1 RNA polymerase sigma-70 factor [Chitinophaga lutea]